MNDVLVWVFVMNVGALLLYVLLMALSAWLPRRIFFYDRTRRDRHD